MAADDRTARPAELMVHPEDLATLGRDIQESVKGMPDAFQRFVAQAMANPAQFGTTSQDQQMGTTYNSFCQAVQDLWPMLYEMIGAKGATVQSWAETFARHDENVARNVANSGNGGK
jgi:hypothetical protein